MSAVVPDLTRPAPDATPADAASSTAARPCEPYDAVLLVSFGGPERPEDVMPFLRRVVRGRDVPEQRLVEVAEHYHLLGGRSPINDQNRALRAAIEADLAGAGVDVPVYWGNRNWPPLLADALAQMAADGVRRAAVFVTSAYASYSGCRQYREDLAAAAAAVAAGSAGGSGLPRLDKLRHYFDHPGFIAAGMDGVLAALDRLPDDTAQQARLVFVTHAIPLAMQRSSGPAGGAYTAQHRAAAAAVVDGVQRRLGRSYRWDLAFCSRSGPASVPWLEPDVNDHLRALGAGGAPAAVLVPIGFVSDHLEVAYDLDTEAVATAARLGLPVVRAATAGTHPRFVAMVRELLLERAAAQRGEPADRPALSGLGPSHDVCPAGCCANPRGPRPALCGRD